MKFPMWIVTAVIALVALMSSVFVVREGHSAIVLNLGRVVRTDLGPGLHFKVPLIETARVFDRRLLVLPAGPGSIEHRAQWGPATLGADGRVSVPVSGNRAAIAYVVRVGTDSYTLNVFYGTAGVAWQGTTPAVPSSPAVP